MSETITRILVPTDFSPHSDAALEYAVALARRLDATIGLLHVVDDPFLSGAWSPDAFVPNATEFLADLVADARRRVDDSVARIAAQGIPTDAAVVTGPPVRMIVEHARTGEFDLIVMGTHGRTGLAHAVLGSVAERVLRSAPCAVLSVKEPLPHREHRRRQLSSVVV